MDGDVWTVVIEDSSGAVNDILIAFDLRHDLLLHVYGRQRNLKRRQRLTCDLWLFGPLDNRGEISILQEIVEELLLQSLNFWLSDHSIASDP
jgi:hypothetical protein